MRSLRQLVLLKRKLIPDIAWPFNSFNLKEWVEDVSTHEQL
jgi:hypothetical protein